MMKPVLLSLIALLVSSVTLRGMRQHFPLFVLVSSGAVIHFLF